MSTTQDQPSATRSYNALRRTRACAAPERKSPTTTAQYRAEIIDSMRHGATVAQRFLSEGKAVPSNPTALPEVSMSLRVSGPRKWKTAQALVQDGVAAIVNGSFEGGSVYLIAGPNFPA